MSSMVIWVDAKDAFLCSFPNAIIKPLPENDSLLLMQVYQKNPMPRNRRGLKET